MPKRISAAKKLLKEKAELDMTPMIDVVFLLLIFFMCTMKFITLEGQLSAELPKDVGLSRSYSPPVLDKLKIFIEYDEKSDTATFLARGSQIRDREKLYNKVREFVNRNPTQSVEISPNGQVPYRYLVLVMDVCRRAEAPEIQFSGYAPEIQ